MKVSTLVQNLAVTIIVAVGIIVLIALDKVSANVGVPILAGLAGVHIGANAATTPSTPTTPTPPTTATTTTQQPTA